MSGLGACWEVIKLKEYNLSSVESTHTHLSKDAFGKRWTTFVNVQVNFTTIRSRYNEELKKGGRGERDFLQMPWVPHPLKPGRTV